MTRTDLTKEGMTQCPHACLEGVAKGEMLAMSWGMGIPSRGHGNLKEHGEDGSLSQLEGRQWKMRPEKRAESS